MITFWYDPVCPYAYVAFERLPQALMGLSIDVRYRPVSLVALTDRNDRPGLTLRPDQRDWTYHHVRWLAHHHDIRLDLPSAHPFNSLPLLYLSLAATTSDMPGETNRYVTEQLFHHVWHGAADATEPTRLASLQALLQDHMAQRQKPWVEPSSEAVKQRLRDNADTALAAGVFDVPTFTCDGRIFGGQDALYMLRAYLEGDS